MKMSVIIPCRDETEGIADTLSSLTHELDAARLDYEIVAVDDGSTDGTGDVLRRLAAENPRLRPVANTGEHGFGMAVRCGIGHATGDAVVIYMADLSDSPSDVVAYARKLEEGYECVFGSRFISGGKVTDYPLHKLLLNRLANGFIQVLFGLRLNDTTNAFKAYRREVIEGISPLFSKHFNLTVEMPLKAIERGYSYAIVPISWTNRKTGVSKLKIKEMGSRYLFIVLYVWLEKRLSRGDYRRKAAPSP
ncbi:MAG: glycosyltransferase family 2 protein [Verrucomicrobiae bacterium]|nr:glycosyltransferase family 2 protein [Verrucomicrobiae bacterium]